ncbi:MAG: hypothetical protein M1827_006709 [Pycnora praestabilis]|nr:MAG: hypothetical protein M1827_006709 [Pycnora praestabilis]
MASSTGNISPPPTKRRRLISTQSPSPSRPTTLPIPSDHQLRIFSWNINGITPFIQQQPITSFFGASPKHKSPLRAFLQRHAWPEVVCLQEVKINAKDEATRRAVERAVNNYGYRDDGPGYEVRFCLPRDQYNAKGFGGKVYGVATIVKDDLMADVVRTREVDWDREGRILIIETASKLAILNLYLVNGTDNPYRNSDTGQLAGTRHDRKLALHQLLLEECKKMEKEGYNLILAGDFNIARSPLDGHPNLRTSPQHARNRADFNDKFITPGEGLGAVDTFRHLHGELRKYTYHSPSKVWGSSADRVDLILISKKLAETQGLLEEAVILDTPEERGTSDHVPLYISMNLRNMLD